METMLTIARRHRSLRRVLGPLAAAGALGLAPAAHGADAAPVAEPVVVATPEAVPADATRLGPAAAASELELRAILRPRDEGQARALALAVASPGSPQYRQYLTQAEYERRFAPTPAALAEVARALRTAGLDVDPPRPGDGSVVARGTVAEAEAAFGTTVERVRLPGGDTRLVNTTAATLPAGVAAHVVHVAGLDTLPAVAASGATTASADGPGPAALAPAAHSIDNPCPDAVAAAAVGSQYQAWLPGQLRQAYGFDGVRGSGRGMSIGMLQLAPYVAADMTAFNACFGIDPHIERIDVAGGPGPTVDTQEPTLVLQTAASLAPEADLLVYQAPDTFQAIFSVLDRMAQDNRADVVVMTWGQCESIFNDNDPSWPTSSIAEGVPLLQMALQGQTFVAAAGDHGSSACVEGDATQTGLAVSDPASQLTALAVGGTTLVAQTPRSETTWNAPYPSDVTFALAGGGGLSAITALPPWQAPFGTAQSSGTPCNATSAWPDGLCRQVPDVSAHAGGDYGYTTYYTGTGTGSTGWQNGEGTAASAALWASLIASISSTQLCSGQRFGQITPALYGMTEPGAFHDITVGDNTLNALQPGFYPALPGYDMASGLGTPHATGLLHRLCPLGPPDPGPVTATGPAPAPELPAPPPAAAAPESPVRATPAHEPADRALVRATVPARPLRLDDGAIPVRVGCPAGAQRCRVTITLTAPGLRVRSAARTIAAESTAAVPLTLTRAQRRQLRRTGRDELRVRLRVTTTSASGGTVTQTVTRTLRL